MWREIARCADSRNGGACVGKCSGKLREVPIAGRAVDPAGRFVHVQCFGGFSGERVGRFLRGIAQRIFSSAQIRVGAGPAHRSPAFFDFGRASAQAMVEARRRPRARSVALQFDRARQVHGIRPRIFLRRARFARTAARRARGSSRPRQMFRAGVRCVRSAQWAVPRNRARLLGCGFCSGGLQASILVLRRVPHPSVLRVRVLISTEIVECRAQIQNQHPEMRRVRHPRDSGALRLTR